MKFSLCLAGMLAFTSASSALAAGPYLAATSGISIFHDSDVTYYDGNYATARYKAGTALGISGGYDFGGVRVEGEFGYKHADVDYFSYQGTRYDPQDSDSTITSYMINGFYDIKTGSRVTPFIGAGIGAIHCKLNDATDTYNDTEFGYQLSTGIGIRVATHLTIDVSYRFQSTGKDFQSDHSASVPYASSNLLGGIRYTF